MCLCIHKTSNFVYVYTKIHIHQWCAWVGFDPPNPWPYRPMGWVGWVENFRLTGWVGLGWDFFPDGLGWDFFLNRLGLNGLDFSCLASSMCFVRSTILTRLTLRICTCVKSLNYKYCISDSGSIWVEIFFWMGRVGLGWDIFPDGLGWVGWQFSPDGLGWVGFLMFFNGLGWVGKIVTHAHHWYTHSQKWVYTCKTTLLNWSIICL